MPYTVNFDLILPRIKTFNRKQTLAEIARHAAARIGCEPAALLSEMIEREYVSPSASGDGIAIPNLKIEGLSKPLIILATLQQPVDFEAADGEGVDIICALFSPHSDGPIHLRELSRITRVFKNETLRSKLRDTKDVDMIRSLLNNPEGWLIAA